MIRGTIQHNKVVPLLRPGTSNSRAHKRHCLPGRSSAVADFGIARRPGKQWHGTSHRQAGLTLVEVLISAIFVGFLLVAALNAVGSIFQSRFRTSNRNSAYLLAEDLIAEIEAVPYADPEGGTGIGTDAGESASDRTTFDDVDDYHGWTQTPPSNRDGTNVTGTTGWTRTVTVEYVTTADPNSPSGSDLGLKRITVTVTGPNSQTVSLATLRSNAGMNELKPPIDRAYITHGTTKLKIGNGTQRQTGSAISNHAEDLP